MTLSIDILFAVYFFYYELHGWRIIDLFQHVLLKEKKKNQQKKNLAESIYAALTKLDWVEYLMAEGNEK